MSGQRQKSMRYNVTGDHNKINWIHCMAKTNRDPVLTLLYNLLASHTHISIVQYHFEIMCVYIYIYIFRIFVVFMGVHPHWQMYCQE